MFQHRSEIVGVLPQPPDRREGLDCLARTLCVSQLVPDLSFLPLKLLHASLTRTGSIPAATLRNCACCSDLTLANAPRAVSESGGSLCDDPAEGSPGGAPEPPGGPDGGAPAPGLRLPRSGGGRPGCAPCSSGTPTTRRTPWSGEPFGRQPSGGCNCRRPSHGGAWRACPTSVGGASRSRVGAACPGQPSRVRSR
jgi:hypothetical protein